MTYRQILDEAITILSDAGIDEASNDAWVLFENVFRMNRTRYFMSSLDTVPEQAVQEYMALVKRRETREPLQYITGKAYFMGLEFNVNESVLIPRFDTEILVEEALKHVDANSEVLDVCTGSGCIAISIGVLGSVKSVQAVDISQEALSVADINIQHNNASNVSLIHSDMFANVHGEFDMIVSNPPYIRTAEVEVLMPEVVMHEPRIAVDGYEDGLHFYRILAEESGHFLKNNGWLIMEIGYDQAEDVTKLLQSNNFTDIKVIRDLAGLDRVVCGRRK